MKRDNRDKKYVFRNGWACYAHTIEDAIRAYEIEHGFQADPCKMYKPGDSLY